MFAIRESAWCWPSGIVSAAAYVVVFQQARLPGQAALQALHEQGLVDLVRTGTEVTEVVLVPIAELEGLLLSGEIEHALVAAALWRYLRLHGPR